MTVIVIFTIGRTLVIFTYLVEGPGLLVYFIIEFVPFHVEVRYSLIHRYLGDNINVLR